jgi:hypothetical protein
MTGADRELESAMGLLKPASSGIDPAAMMFQAGRSAGRGRQRTWQALAGVLAACLVLSLAARPAPRQVERIVYVPAVQAAPVATTPDVSTTDASLALGMGDYMKLRQQVLEHGMDALPAVQRVRGGSTEARQGVKDLLAGQDL